MSEIPADVEAWIGQKRYELWGDFDVERGYVFTTCSSVMNGNPLFWDEQAAREITNGLLSLCAAPIATVARLVSAVPARPLRPRTCSRGLFRARIPSPSDPQSSET